MMTQKNKSGQIVMLGYSYHLRLLFRNTFFKRENFDLRTNQQYRIQNEEQEKAGKEKNNNVKRRKKVVR